MASVASAAIIEGSLIIGLDDGSIINCGFVQGPQGLKGDPGPMGATGDPGLDGNTIHTVAGTPRNDMGRDGDYAIDNVNWRIYGPKSGGVWGKAKEMLPGPENIIENGRNTGAATGGGGAGGGSGDGGPVFTNTVIATGAGRLAPSTGTTAIVNYPGSPLGMISPESGMGFQSNINAFFVKALEELEVNIPVVIDEDRPQVGVYQGMLWFDTSEEDYTLYIYDGVQWVPAAPPVSLEGIEQSIYHISEKLSVVETGIVGARLDIAGNAGEIESVKTRAEALETSQGEQDLKIEALETSQAVQDNQIIELEEEIESLAPSLDRGKWTLHEAMPLSAGQYAIGVAVNSGYCIDQYERCIQAAPGYPDNIDPVAQSECTRLAADCETAKENGELLIADWAHAGFLHFHKTDSDGKNHTFADYEVGMFIDLFDQGDTGFAVFEITAEPTLADDVYTIGVTPVQHEGEAAGLARVKVFELAGAEVTDFVRKTGDEMSGDLTLAADAYNSDSDNYPALKLVHPNSEGNPAVYSIRATNSGFSFNSSIKTASTINAYGNLQYKGSTRVGMTSGTGTTNYLGVGTNDSNKALIWDQTGVVKQIQASNGLGTSGQVLTKASDTSLEWATPAGQAQPGFFSWIWESYSSSYTNSKHFQWKDGKFIYLSRYTYEGIKLINPENLPTGAQYFSSFLLSNGVSSAKTLKMWMHTSSGWELMAWAVPYKYRFNFGGWCQIEYTSRQGSLPDVEGSRWCISCPDLF